MQRVDFDSSPDKRRSTLLMMIVSIIRILRKISIKLKNFGKVRFGRNSYIGKRSDIFVPESAVISDNVSIASDFFSQVDFEIGGNTLISSKVSFIGNDHDLSLNPESAYHSGRLPPSKIILEGNNFIGFGSTILGSVRLGYGAIVASNSFVNKDVPPRVIVAGVPAKIIKMRDDL